MALLSFFGSTRVNFKNDLAQNLLNRSALWAFFAYACTPWT